jgi:ABC-type transport system involved in cytochrome c biogenesis permease subunit
MQQRLLVQSPGSKTPGWRIVPEDADVRLLLAVGFSVLFAGTIVAAFWITFANPDPKSTWAIVKEFLAVLLPAETGLLGSILGFYFGSTQRSKLIADGTAPDTLPPE